jgi:hypothetical protein
MGRLSLLLLLTIQSGCFTAAREAPDLYVVPYDSTSVAQPGEIPVTLGSKVKLFSAPDRTTFCGNLSANTRVFISEYRDNFFRVRVKRKFTYVPEESILPYASAYHIEPLILAEKERLEAVALNADTDTTNGIPVTLQIETQFLDGPSVIHGAQNIPSGTKVLAVGYTRSYFKVRLGSSEGYIDDFHLGFQQGMALNKKLDVLREEGKRRDASEDVAAQKAQQKIEEDRLKAFRQKAAKQAAEAKVAREEAEREREQGIRARYGDPVIAQNILDHKIWIGMTAQMARDSWGNPGDVNRTVTARGTHEQWVYGGGVYLYFTDGVLTSYQD